MLTTMRTTELSWRAARQCQAAAASLHLAQADHSPTMPKLLEPRTELLELPLLSTFKLPLLLHRTSRMHCTIAM